MTSSSKTNSPHFKRKTSHWVVKSPTYVNLDSSSEEHQNEKTPSLPPRKKSLSPPQAPSKSISNKSTHYTSSSSLKTIVESFLGLFILNWRSKVTAIEESKDLSSLALDKLIRNLNVHEVVMVKDSKIYKCKKETAKSISLKAKKESSDDETSTSRSNDEEYDMDVIRMFLPIKFPYVHSIFYASLLDVEVSSSLDSFLAFKEMDLTLSFLPL
ncbi:hypothetical protein Tco_0099924 [Tanacetum coccineum]